MKKSLLAAALIGLAAVTQAPPAVYADGFADLVSRAVRKAVKVENVREHQQILQTIANRNGGTRASGTPGYKVSADYVRLRLKLAGYDVKLLPFDFPFFEEHSPSRLARTNPGSVTYVNGTDFLTMEYSGSGSVSAQLQDAGGIIIPPTPLPSSSSGCDAADFAGFVAGRIALIQRGTCTFATKALNAQAAGASAVIIFNEGQPGRRAVFNGTLGGPVDIPVLAASFDLGQRLFNLTNPTLSLFTDTTSETRETYNVLAESKFGQSRRTVVVGAHLDSVAEGPGINDNGSGSATVLEVAIRLARFTPYIQNKVRFMFFGAEEAGLLGSEAYLASLSQEKLDRILLNLNFDMVGSPNFVRFVYDGDGSDTPDPGPVGSEVIEDVFLDYFTFKGLATDPTAFDGRSDYGPFIDRGIPAGGLFSGAEGIKTAEQEAKYGGTAGDPYDACYHLACDTFANNNNRSLDQLSDATAHAVVTFAFAGPDVIASADAKSRTSQRVAASSLLYRGSHLQK